MGRHKIDPDRRRKKYSVYLPPDCAEWLEDIPPGQRGRAVTDIIRREIAGVTTTSADQAELVRVAESDALARCVIERSALERMVAELRAQIDRLSPGRTRR